MKIKSFGGFEKDSKVTDPYAVAIGKFFINFGAVELLTYSLINKLSEDEIIYELSTNMPISKRIDLINKLAEKRNLNKALINEIKEVNKVAIKMAELRNLIAHNPIILRVNENKETSEAYVGIPKWKKAVDQSAIPIVNVTIINKGVDAVAELAENINGIMVKIDG